MVRGKRARTPLEENRAETKKIKENDVENFDRIREETNNSEFDVKNGEKNDTVAVSEEHAQIGSKIAPIQGKNEQNVSISLIITQIEFRMLNESPLTEQILEREKVKLNSRNISTGSSEFICILTGLPTALGNCLLEMLPIIFSSEIITLRLAFFQKLSNEIIGNQQVHLKQLSVASGGLSIQASESLLPCSNELSLCLEGNVNQVALAGQQIAYIFAENSVILSSPLYMPYIPQPIFGKFGAPTSFADPSFNNYRPSPSNPYGLRLNDPYSTQHLVETSMKAIQEANIPIDMNNTNYVSNAQMLKTDAAVTSAQEHTQTNTQEISPQITQQIYIPNDMVGSIIGKGGAKINEIRVMSGSHIKINEPEESAGERLVTITGTSESNKMALFLLYQKLESEKHRV